MPAEQRLLLVGAGHAHLHLVRHAGRLARAGYRTTLVAPASFDYSGAASSTATGGRDREDGRIDVAALARTGPAEHRPGVVTAVDPVARTAIADDGAVIEWDVMSLNIGSVADLAPVPTRGTPIVRVKPLEDLIGLRERLQQPAAGHGHRITVIGAGASGIELAAHLSARHDVARVHLLEQGARIGGFLPHRAARRIVGLLERRGVRMLTQVRLERIEEEAVLLADGTGVPHDIVVVATGLVPPPLATRAPLGGRNGFPVRATLQHRDHDDVYAAGDCADFLPVPLPRIGVHGVRQGPVLLAALEARSRGDRAPVYRPQREALSILDLGGGTALAVRGRWWWLGRASLALKRRIDERWLATYRVERR